MRARQHTGRIGERGIAIHHHVRVPWSRRVCTRASSSGLRLDFLLRHALAPWYVLSALGVLCAATLMQLAESAVIGLRRVSLCGDDPHAQQLVARNRHTPVRGSEVVEKCRERYAPKSARECKAGNGKLNSSHCACSSVAQLRPRSRDCCTRRDTQILSALGRGSADETFCGVDRHDIPLRHSCFKTLESRTNITL